MDIIRIRGGNRLSGSVRISGSKNAALPVMAASLLTDQPLILRNLPQVADVTTMARLLRQHGVDIEELSKQSEASTKGESGQVRAIRFQAQSIDNITASYDLVRRMRASILVLGALAARCGRARVSFPGGCAIGARPVDLHLSGLRKLGAEIEIVSGYIDLRAPNGLRGEMIVFPSVSVGATMNLLLAASMAEGESVLINAAREPEVVELAACLRSMGAWIEGAGSARITICGRQRLEGTDHCLISDRIELATYAIAAGVTGGQLRLFPADLGMIQAVVDVLTKAGMMIEQQGDTMLVSACERQVTGVDVVTEPYPGFPTDLQAQLMVLMTKANGAAMITEGVFENRFMHVPELTRMGADITIHHRSALVRGVKRLTGAQVMATDLRASVSLVLAGLAAEGITQVLRVYHLARGYENLVAKLAGCGAHIEQIKEQQT